MSDNQFVTQLVLETEADVATAHHWARNHRALRQTQRWLADELEQAPIDVEWVRGRDGSLTARQHDRWWKGCSLPTKAAEQMLAKADLYGTIVCFLYPLHAGQIRVALDKLHGSQAILALVPELLTLRVILSCDDFAEEISGHRMYFAAGDEWESQLDRLFEENLGLPTPVNFVRPILADHTPADELVEPAQKIFAKHSAKRAERVKEMQTGWRRRGKIHRVCLVAPSQFRLWDDTGAALGNAVYGSQTNIEFERFDSDDPASASPAALAERAMLCDAIVTPNSARSDLPGLVSLEMPWTTWLTTPRVPEPTPGADADSVIIADPQWRDLAISRGWNADRIFVGGWPALALSAPAEAGVFRKTRASGVAILSNTRSLQPPAKIKEYSSHRIIWENIAAELSGDPMKLNSSPDAYLAEKIAQACIDLESVDRTAFIDGVIQHAFQQGIARLLAQAGLPLKLYGAGWDTIDDLASFHAGPLDEREQLGLAIESSAVLLHVWPASSAHPIEAADRPLIRCFDNGENLIRDMQVALSINSSPARRNVQPISNTLILQTFG